MRPSVALWSFVAACAASAPAYAGIVRIDLRQTGNETPSIKDIAGDTWRWDGDMNNQPGQAFNLEFSSGNGSHVDLDGGSFGANEYYTGAEATTNHAYDEIFATFLGGNLWAISAKRGATNFSLGNITEYSGILDHVANYGYGGGQESNPVNGPSDSGENSAAPSQWKAWFWIYRNTVADTISLNFTAGSGKSNTDGDQGQFRAEIYFSGLFTGTALELQGNEPGEITDNGLNSFKADLEWGGSDDGGVLGGIRPLAEPIAAPLPPAAWSGLGLLGAMGVWTAAKRRRALRAV